MTRVTQSRDALEEHLREQMRYLRRSSEAYDAGDDAEAKRLATIVRVLVHDTRQSRALLGQLGIKAKLKFVDTAGEPPLPNVYDAEGRAIRVALFSSDLAPLSFGPTVEARGPGYRPMLDRADRGSPRAFQPWWTAQVMQDGRGSQFTRRLITLALANQDGGAHVDPKLDAAYEAMSRGGSMGHASAVRNGVEVALDLVNPALGCMRQIAWEVETTLVEQLGPMLTLP